MNLAPYTVGGVVISLAAWFIATMLLNDNFRMWSFTRILNAFNKITKP